MLSGAAVTYFALDRRKMKPEYINTSIEGRTKRTTNFAYRKHLARTINQRNWELLGALRRVTPAIYKEEPFNSSRDQSQVLKEMRRKMAVRQSPRRREGEARGSPSGDTWAVDGESDEGDAMSPDRSLPELTRANTAPASGSGNGRKWKEDEIEAALAAVEANDNNARSGNNKQHGNQESSGRPSTTTRRRNGRGRGRGRGKRKGRKLKAKTKAEGTLSLGIGTPRQHPMPGRIPKLPSILNSDDTATVFFSHDCLVPFVSANEDDTEYREMPWDIAIIDVAKTRRPTRGLLIRGSRRDAQDPFRRMTTDVMVDLATLEKMVFQDKEAGAAVSAPPDLRDALSKFNPQDLGYNRVFKCLQKGGRRIAQTGHSLGE